MVETDQGRRLQGLLHAAERGASGGGIANRVVRVAVTGTSGLVGGSLVAQLDAAGHQVVPLTRTMLDLENPASQSAFSVDGAAYLVHAAAWTDVDGCARNPERAMDLNGRATSRIAARARQLNARVLYVSTNEVFDGVNERPYEESDAPAPVNPYGASKLAGEAATLAAGAGNVVVRTAWVHDRTRGFPARIRHAAAGGALKVVDDEWGNPTPAADLAAAMIKVLELMALEEAPPIVHLAGEPAVSRYGWAAAVLAGSGTHVEAIASASFQRASRVPLRAVLSTALAASLRVPPIRWRVGPER
ncbi:MAG: sugar nucleotide-binding protein [Chloroflexota bacterium]